MANRAGADLIAARPDDAERLAVLSRTAKLSYRKWAPSGWQAPALAAERERWQRRLLDPAGSTLIASGRDALLGAIHFTDARHQRGEGKPIAGRGSLSGLFVLPASGARKRSR